MADYTFFPIRSDGSVLSFEILALADDRAAIGHAPAVLVEHAFAVLVEMWRGERFVYRETRRPASPRGESPDRP